MNRVEARSIVDGEIIDGLTFAEGFPTPDTPDAMKMFLAGGKDDLDFAPRLIVLTTRRLVVGDIGFHGPPDGEGRVEVGYGIAQSQRRRGYATRALEALAEWALNRPDVRVVTASIAGDNIASRRVAERSGFVAAAEREGEVEYRISRS